MNQVDTKSMIEWGFAARTLPGFAESGDLHVASTFPGGALIGVIDGLGHGHEAAVAAKMAALTLEKYPHESLTFLVRQCHEKLKGTRGMVMTVASLNFIEDEVTWIGIGNVEGVLCRARRPASPQ